MFNTKASRLIRDQNCDSQECEGEIDQLEGLPDAKEDEDDIQQAYEGEEIKMEQFSFVPEMEYSPKIEMQR